MLHKFDSNSEAVFNKVSQRQDSTFKLLYFPIHGVAYASRLILATTGAKFESASPTNWVEQKATTPFGVLPVLYETVTTKEGDSEVQEVFEIPESEAIERYLARKFQLLGQTPWEEMKINAFVSSTKSLTFLAFSRIPTVKDTVQKQEMVQDMVNKSVPAWVQSHERYLVANGTNGHYIGDKLTLADIRALIVIELVLALTEDRVISQEKTPAIWKLWEGVRAIPSFVAWRNTDSYKQFDAGYQTFVKGLLPLKEQ
ncbi:hypothetical protein BGZ80_006430 [Entomortierella chlamydospora]|uniref:Glutathione s-transferase n=1 Tax=Entomortierella chlamydospora TaxID=101097 RepID=A0A9P6STD1_9FUNG|nr:hypothetical protein BGZ80_006430 [Entomortierella chlamydospora]KAG0000443.1 hypothetical protein BGZ79_005937 [Entomortierella chlamydospora]